MSGIGDGGGIGPLGRDPYSTLDALRSGRIQGKEGKLRAAADLMESSFFQELFKALRQTVPEGGMVNGGGGEDMFSSLMDQHIADVAASTMSRGLGEALYRHFAGPQGVASQESEGGADAMKVGNTTPTSRGIAR
jgi:flagellar protein FlgJ